MTANGARPSVPGLARVSPPSALRWQRCAAFVAACFLNLTPLAVAAAPTLALPASATRAAEEAEAMGSHALPVGPFAGGTVATLVAEGQVTRTAWRIADSTATTLELLAPLRSQLQAEGFSVLFECATDICGGFDFRYATDVLPEPEMHVDLSDFRFLSAKRLGIDGPEFVSLLVSRSSTTGFVQLTRVGATLQLPLAVAATAPEAADGPSDTAIPAPAEPLAQSLDGSGAVVLDDLVFETGSSTLQSGDFASLRGVAAYLAAHPDRKITIVGHTDAQGSLAANLALSRQRARSVVESLVDLGVARAQLTFDGVGFLAPRASNLTETGRTQNRRVEAMLTSTR